MLLKDFLLNTVLRGTNQRLPSNLLGLTGLVGYVNFALDDIYTYEGKYWTWMYDMIEFDTTTDFTDSDAVVYVDVPYPLLRVLYIEDMSDDTNSISYQQYVRREQSDLYKQWEALNIIPTDAIDANTFYYKQHTKRIYLPNNKDTYRIHYVHYFDRIEYDDETQIPIPDVFLGALYSLTMGYIYPNYGQQGENKEANAYNKGRQQLVDLAKTDSMQLSGIYGTNIK